MLNCKASPFLLPLLLFAWKEQGARSQDSIIFPRVGENSSAQSFGKAKSLPDLTKWVNPFVGTIHDGNVNPGASVPFGVVKISADCKGYNPAGYTAKQSAQIYGFSPLHDSGIGVQGSYNIFEIMPLNCSKGVNTCRPHPDDRLTLRKPGYDVAAPGYFSMTLNLPNVTMEGTSTRLAGRHKYSFSTNGSRYFALDLTRDGTGRFQSGNLTIDPASGRVRLGGIWPSGFAPGAANYQAFACYDLTENGKQPLENYGVWTMTSGWPAETNILINQTQLSSSGVDGGVIFSYPQSVNVVELRLGVSFVSADQACTNMEAEVGNASFEEVRKESVRLWNEKLGRLEIPLAEIKPELAVMLYTSMYRSFLTPHNATGEGQGPFLNTKSPYFDSLYCTWDTFRTFFPWMNLHSPVESAQIAENYIDGWRKTGAIPACRANNVAGYIQGGSSGTNVLADFAVKYHDLALELGVSMDDMYKALLNDGEVTPADWLTHGRQNSLYKKFGFIPHGESDGHSSGMNTRESSRTIEYAFNDFAIAQVARVLGHKDVAKKYSERSLWYRNVWDPDTTSDGFRGFFQKRWGNGTFFKIDPAACSPKDKNPNRQCFLDWGADTGFYESSSWEYSYFAPHDTSHLIELHGGAETFLRRLEHFFDKGYYNPGNEPAFQTPVAYHYANRPTLAVSRIRSLVLKHFNIGPGGIPGNDDNGAMATWLLFHLLGLYPVPSTTEYLISTPWVPRYTIHNPYLNVSTTVKVTNFDPASNADPIPNGVAAFISEVKLNGKALASKCQVDFHQLFRKGGELEMVLTSDRSKAEGCGGPVPQSLSPGGFGFPPTSPSQPSRS
ncbi:hypothetical protein O181_014521 [Austropuccinia psidii MF-1]|uniref:Glycoside hydrolase family 92 protein n=1 Tax=Austropuccinia psidii MF-1 TaxID=1389203 RepID=A0A9Q3GP80_9BASI|nr:hypothetical protein [Austropuccinia psidii MF-1]